MNIFDFISDSPRIYIFQKKANKTNLGGVLTFFYLIILLLIIIAYMYDYYNNEQFQYTYFYKNIKEEDRKKYKEEHNQKKTFRFEIRDKFEENILNDKFAFFDLYSGMFINGTITKNIDELSIGILYKCNRTTDDCNDKNQETHEYNLYIYYEGKNIDHENPDFPVINSTIIFLQRFFSNNLAMVETYWGIYNYEEEKGIWSKIYDKIFEKENKYNFGLIESSQVYSLPSSPYYIIYDDSNIYKLLMINQMFNRLNGIHQYKRKAKSIWDSLANIAALGATIFNIICKAFGLIYSSNFDNYKIIENILSKEAKKLKKIELNPNESNKDLKNDLLYKDKNEYDLNNQDIIINDIDDLDKDNIEDNEVLISKLPKLRFFDFFFNNIYSNCCVYIKKQKLIDSCDNILYKYYSIENILYNQILFDNLMKDYQWNNPNLKSIHKNELIISLNKYIS